jgi:hypothetical protein
MPSEARGKRATWERAGKGTGGKGAGREREGREREERGTGWKGTGGRGMGREGNRKGTGREGREQEGRDGRRARAGLPRGPGGVCLVSWWARWRVEGGREGSAVKGGPTQGGKVTQRKQEDGGHGRPHRAC